MEWDLDETGTREEIKSVVDTTAGVPDAVKSFVNTATSYHSEEAKFNLTSTGNAVENGAIASCDISFERIPEKDSEPYDE